MTAKKSLKKYTHYHNDGSIWAKGFMTGKFMTGYWEWFRKDGTKMRSGHFDKNKQVGEWITYDQKGKIYKKTMMKTAPDIWSKKTPLAKDVTAFIKSSPQESQGQLKKLRALIKSTVPQAVEGISYRMPVYRLRGKQLVGFAGYKYHVGFYPMSGSFLKVFKKELKNYQTSKGAVQFPLDQKLPIALIKKIITAKIQELKNR